MIDENFNKYFKSYNFHNLYKELLNFCTVELSAFYFDIRKDLLYCDPKDSKKRSDCILILKVILECLLKWFAPILSFTTEEIYHLIYKEDSDGSIHLQKFVKIPNQWKNEELNNKWDKLKLIRDEANISIESKRADKIIGSSLEANIEIKIKDKDMYSLAKNHDFSEICITSSASILSDSSLEKEIEITSSKAVGNKCPVCWKIRENICERDGNCHLS
jgi:isoleucyl-tRNA synthetase